MSLPRGEAVAPGSRSSASSLWASGLATVRGLVATFLAAMALVITLLIVVHSIPNDAIAAHVRHSLSPVNYQTSPLNWGQIDYFTECVAVTGGLTGAAYMGVLRQAFLSPTLFDCENAKKSLATGQGEVHYWRYWHGYQLISRPVLYLGDLHALRTVVFLIFCFSCFLFFESIRKWAGSAYAAITLLALLCVPIYSALYIIAHGPVWAIAFCMAAALLTLAQNRQLFQKRHLHIFLIAGVATSFVDLLTTPLITLTVPLLALYWAKAWANPSPGLPSWASAALAAGVWAMGYISCWALKWIIVIAVFDGDPTIVTGSLAHRLSGPLDWDRTVQPTVGMSLAENLRQCWSGLIVVTGFLVARVGMYLGSPTMYRITFPFPSFADALCFGFLFALPFVWVMILRNHSFVHAWFVSQILYPSFALVLGLIYNLISPARGERGGSRLGIQ